MSTDPPRAAGAPTPKVFISYRREETAAHAGRLHDAMVARFGEHSVFMDVDLAPGIDFVDRITEAVSACHVLLVIMGPRWATVEDEEGTARIADPEDFVRLEVETALQRSDVTVIPVLVSGAKMPDRDELPQEIGAITRRNALDISDSRWRYDVGRLNGTLDELLANLTGVQPAPQPERPAPSLSRGRVVLEGVVVGAMTALVARWLGDLLFPEATDTAGRIVGVILRRTETFAFAAAALGIWHALRAGGADLFRRGMGGLLVGATGGAVGGAIFAFAVHLPADKPDAEVVDWISVGSFAVNGAFLGAFIGALWRPPRLGVGLASGLVAGAVIEVILNGIGWTINSDFEQALASGIRVAAIVGLAVASVLALGSQESTAQPDAVPRSG